jgi:hypothetical protein
MRRNPSIEFVIVTIVDDIAETKAAQEHIDRASASNIKMVPITVAQFKSIVKAKLGIDHPMQRTSEVWARKLPDFKPVVAHLFREHLLPKHKYWGYCDMDVIWGNVSHYAHWFQGEYPVVKSHFYPHGPLQFFANDDVFIEMYVKPNKYFVDSDFPDAIATYKNALVSEVNYNLDEIGKYTPDIRHCGLSVEQVLNRYIEANKLQWNGGGDMYRTNVVMDPAKCRVGRHGPMIWQNGALKLVNPSANYPAGREIMLLHRPSSMDIFGKLSERMRKDIIDDMIAYGYLLPNWTPLMTRYVCKKKVLKAVALHDYRPYSTGCFGRNTTDRVIIHDQDPENKEEALRHWSRSR